MPNEPYAHLPQLRSPRSRPQLATPHQLGTLHVPELRLPTVCTEQGWADARQQLHRTPAPSQKPIRLHFPRTCRGGARTASPLRPLWFAANLSHEQRPSASEVILAASVLPTTPSLASVWQAQHAVKGRALDRALGRPPQLASVPERRFGTGRPYQPLTIPNV